MRPHSRVLPQVNFGILTADAFLAGRALLFALPGIGDGGVVDVPHRRGYGLLWVTLGQAFGMGQGGGVTLGGHAAADHRVSRVR